MTLTHETALELAKLAGLVLTEDSVVDECFWELFGSAGATSFAGVPYTFDLLDRSGFARRDLPNRDRLTFDTAIRTVGGRRMANHDPQALARVTFDKMTAAQVVADARSRGID